MPTAVVSRGEKGQYFLGNVTRKIKVAGNAKTITQPVIVKTFEKVAALLNLKEATAEQTVRADGDKEVNYYGSDHGKTIIISDPTGAKTPKGKVKTVNLQMPGYLTVKQMKTLLAPTKAKKFRIQGGRKYSAQ